MDLSQEELNSQRLMPVARIHPQCTQSAPLPLPDSDSQSEYGCPDATGTDSLEQNRPICEIIKNLKEAQYACYRCTLKGLVCEVVPGDRNTPCLQCKMTGIGRVRCNADQIFATGKGDGGELRSRIRRAVWHHTHRMQTAVGGKYPHWHPTPVFVNLAATKQVWEKAVRSPRGKDPNLWRDIDHFRKNRTDLGEIARYLKKKAIGSAARLEKYNVGMELLARMERDVPGLESQLLADKEDLIDDGILD